MKSILNQLYEHKTLSAAEARAVLQNMAMGSYKEAEIASFITVYLMRSITEEELGGFRDALLDMAIQVDLGKSDFIDVCGTGVTAFRTDYFNPIGIYKSEHKRMSDLVFSLEAIKQNKKIMQLKHKQGWIKQQIVSSSIASTYVNNCKEQILLANQIIELKTLTTLKEMDFLIWHPV